MTTEYINNKTFEALIIKFQKSKKEQAKFKLLMEDIKETEQRMFSKKYQKPDAWKNIEANSKIIFAEFQDVQSKLASAFYILAENIVRYAKFNLIDQDDAIQECVMISFEKVDRFDPKKGKAFNFATTINLNCLKQYYRSAKNYNELKSKYLDFMSMQVSQPHQNTKKGLHKQQNISFD